VFHSLDEAVEQIRVWQGELEEGGEA